MPNRRRFLQAAGAAAATPYFYSAPRTLADEITSKNDRVVMGVIGAGGMANGNINTVKNDWVDVVAIADCDAGRADRANENMSGGKADVYEDYRKVIERKDLDAIHIATPDHWHTKPLIEAMLAGKDVYCEKPLTLTIDEGKQIREVQKETGAIVQVGTQQRSGFPNFVTAMAIVNEGRLGKIRRIRSGINGAPKSGAIPVAETPKGLNWDLWLGPAPAVDYRFRPEEGKRGKSNCHYEFRWWYEYSGGKMTDWGAHHVDIANWALTLNGQTGGPTGISGSAEHPVDFKDGMPVQNDRYNTATKFTYELPYAGGTTLTITSEGRRGVLIEGDRGRIFVNRESLEGAPVEELKDNPLPEDAIAKVYKGQPIQFNNRKAHWANFLHCVRERIDPISDVHSHLDGLNLCHMAGIAARTGEDLEWNATDQEFVGNDLANSMLSRPYRSGYEIEMGVVAS